MEDRRIARCFYFATFHCFVESPRLDELKEEKSQGLSGHIYCKGEEAHWMEVLALRKMPSLKGDFHGIPSDPDTCFKAGPGNFADYQGSSVGKKATPNGTAFFSTVF